MNTAQKILIVDDEPNNIRMAARILQSEGYDLSEATNGARALHMIRDDKPDLIILDYMMPGMDGIEVCKKIRADPDIKQPKILMITAQIQGLDRVRSLLAGANDYTTKPIDLDDLVGRVKALLESK